MTEAEEFDPNSQKELVLLLPDRCNECLFAPLLILATVHGISKFSSPMEAIKDIEEQCIGYQTDYAEALEDAETIDSKVCPYMGVLAAKYGHDT